MHIYKFLSLSCLSLLFSRASALYVYVLIRCQFTSPHDYVYLEQIYFNKVFLGQYNSTLGKYIGYTDKGKEVADELNRSKVFFEQEKKNEEKCKSHLPQIFDLILLSKAAEPSVKLRSVKAASSKHPGMLVCSAYGFYPKEIRVTWLRDGKKVTSDVTSTEELPNGNWLYQLHSHLEITPEHGEKISCMVEHASLMEPKLYDWDPMPESEMNKIAVGTAGLLLGLVLVLTGLIFYKMNKRGRELVPTN